MNSSSSSLKGKSGILTGGTSGFGYEIAQALAARGANVAVFSIDEAPVKEEPRAGEPRAGEIGRGLVEYRKIDITAPDAAETMVKASLDLFGTIDFVVVNAGFAIRFEEPLLSIPSAKIAESMRRQFEIFPIAFATLALEAAKVMAPKYESMPQDDMGHRHDSGAIIVTLSEAALSPLRDDLLAYSAAKKACHWVMRSLAATLGPKNIRVNGIAPGFANTEGPRKFYDRFPRIREDIEKGVHLKPAFMDPSAVVPAVLYLLTDNYCTGEVIALDGGYNIQLESYFQ
jgi:NAD(P)-dependent dehydrogenase (short-subunit alcohol dehydrogenase family)